MIQLFVQKLQHGDKQESVVQSFLDVEALFIYLDLRVQGKQLSLPSASLPPSKVSVSSFSVCFQSSCLRCLRRRASSLSLTTTSWERRSTRRRGFAFPECSCRANSPSPANHRAPDVCQLRNARRFRETGDWNVWNSLAKTISTVSCLVELVQKRVHGRHTAGFESCRCVRLFMPPSTNQMLSFTLWMTRWSCSFAKRWRQFLYICGTTKSP